MAGLQEFPRSLNSAEKEGKLAHASTKLLIWCEDSAKERDSVMSSHWQVGHGGRSSGQLRVLSRREAVFVYFASTVSLVCNFAISSRSVSIRCPVSRMAST